MSLRILAALLLFAITLPTACALPMVGPGPLPPVPGDPTPNAPDAVVAEYDVALRGDLSGFDLAIALEVYEFQMLAGRSLPAQAVRDAPNRDVFEEAVERRILAEVQSAFPDANTGLDSVVYDYGALDADADPYRPPIRVIASASALFTAAYLGLPELGDVTPATAAAAFLESGGVYTMDEKVRVAPGAAVTLRVTVPEPVRLAVPGGPEAERLTFALDNQPNGTARTLPVRLSVGYSPSAIPPEVVRGPLVRVAFLVEDRTSLARQAVPFAQGEFVGTLKLDIEVVSLEGRYFDHYPLPDGLRMERMSADVLRVAFAAGLVGADDVEAFFERLVTRGVQKAFGNETVVDFDAGAFAESLRLIDEADDTIRPILVRAQSTVPVRVQDQLVAASFARAIGMVVPTRDSVELTNQGIWDMEYTIVYPSTLRVTASDAGGLVENLQVDGRDAVRVYLARGSTANISLTGKAVFDPAVFAIQSAELGLVGLGLVLGARNVRARVRGRSKASGVKYDP